MTTIKNKKISIIQIFTGISTGTIHYLGEEYATIYRKSCFRSTTQV